MGAGASAGLGGHAPGETSGYSLSGTGHPVLYRWPTQPRSVFPARYGGRAKNPAAVVATGGLSSKSSKKKLATMILRRWREMLSPRGNTSNFSRSHSG